MKAQTQRSLRQYHHYIGVFFAPMILFFAFTGALQTFSLHEAKGYDGGTPPSWIVWLASVHKDQGPPHKKAAAAPAKAAAAPAVHDDHDDHATDDHHDGAPAAKRPSPLPLKIFILLMAIGLSLSSLLGITIALTNRATRRVSVMMLLAGAVLPCVLLWV